MSGLWLKLFIKTNFDGLNVTAGFKSDAISLNSLFTAKSLMIFHFALGPSSFVSSWYGNKLQVNASQGSEFFVNAWKVALLRPAGKRNNQSRQRCWRRAQFAACGFFFLRVLCLIYAPQCSLNNEAFLKLQDVYLCNLTNSNAHFAWQAKLTLFCLWNVNEYDSIGGALVYFITISTGQQF